MRLLLYYQKIQNFCVVWIVHLHIYDTIIFLVFTCFVLRKKLESYLYIAHQCGTFNRYIYIFYSVRIKTSQICIFINRLLLFFSGYRKQINRIKFLIINLINASWKVYQSFTRFLLQVDRQHSFRLD